MKFNVSHGTIYGSRYHTVEMLATHWGIMTIEWRPIEKWCTETFGPDGGNTWDIDGTVPDPMKRWYMNNRKFWFKDEADLTLFLLRWS